MKTCQYGTIAGKEIAFLYPSHEQTTEKDIVRNYRGVLDAG